MGTNYHPVRPIEERFWSKVVQTGPDTCWRWTGGKNEHGYGVIGRGKRGQGFEKAHRVSWMIHHGDIPAGLFVCHKCDNPECTNPKHLFLGTRQENTSDMVAKGRNAHGETSYAKLTYAQVQEIRARYQPGKVSQYQLAREYGVSRSLIGYIVTGQRWNSGHS